MWNKRRVRHRDAVPALVVALLAVVGGGTAQEIIEVDSWSDGIEVSPESSSATLTEYCGTSAQNAGNCSLRAALAYASTFGGSDVTITVTAEQDLVLTQSTAMKITGASSLVLDGRGHTIKDDAGDSCFLVSGPIGLVILNTTFDSFHSTGNAAQVCNGVVISAEDPDPSLLIKECTFKDAYQDGGYTTAGTGGVIYTKGTLHVVDSVFDSNMFSSASTPTPGAVPTTSPTPEFNQVPTSLPISVTQVPDVQETTAPKIIATPGPSQAPEQVSSPAPVSETMAPLAPETAAPVDPAVPDTPSPVVIETAPPVGSPTPAPTLTPVIMVTPAPVSPLTIAPTQVATLVPTPGAPTLSPLFDESYTSFTEGPFGYYEEYATRARRALKGDRTVMEVWRKASFSGKVSPVPVTHRILETSSFASFTQSSEYSEGGSYTYLSHTYRRIGGAVYWDNRAQDASKTLQISGCVFSGNSLGIDDEEAWGGALVAAGGAVNVTSTVFSNNWAAFGGALVLQLATATMSDCEFTANVADQFGGAIVQVSAGSMDVSETTFDSNVAGEGGGALTIATANATSTYILTDCVFLGNIAGGSGGGAIMILVDSEGMDEGNVDEALIGTMTLIRPTFVSNTADQYGSNVNLMCGNVVIDSPYSATHAIDEEAFTILPSAENCSSLAFVSSDGSPPAMSSTRFSDTGASLIIKFDSDTDYGSSVPLGGSFECSFLLDYPGISSADVCSWTSASAITATLHYGATVTPGDSLTLGGGILASLSNGVVASESSIDIAPPESPPVPKLTPSVLYTALAHCQDLVVDVTSSTGSGGRVMSSYAWDLYNWVVANDDDTPEVELGLTAAASGQGATGELVLPALSRAAEGQATWNFNVSATNWLGGIGWATFEVLVSAAAKDPPLLSLIGGSSKSVLRSSSLSITAVAEAISCQNVSTAKAATLTYEWSEIRSGDVFESSSADPSVFRLPAYSLEVGTTYEFQVTVTDILNFSSKASQVITVESSLLLAAVAGGNRTITGGGGVILDLSASIDPDQANGSCIDCVFTASCVPVLDGTSCNLTLPAEEFTNDSLPLLANELEVGETYTLEISVRRSAQKTRSTTTTVLAIGTREETPTLVITSATQKVNPGDAVAIMAEMTSSFDNGAVAEWSLTEGILEGSGDLSRAVDSSITYTVSGIGTISANMVLRANSLVTGSLYTFSLSAAYLSSASASSDGNVRRLQSSSSSDTGVDSSASITFLVNSPPTSGILDVSPVRGSAMTSAFLMRTHSWEDDVDDLPLTYLFAYVSGSANESDVRSEVIVRPALESAQALDVYLPQGYGTNDTLVASVYAIDALGAYARETFTVSIAPYTDGIVQLAEVVEELADEALEAADADTLMQVLDVAAAILNTANCTAAPDCAALGRLDCGLDDSPYDNTCGECLSGYVGVLGSGNTACAELDAIPDACFNQIQDADESDVDCGGPSCSPCTTLDTCSVDSDCLYNNCLVSSTTLDSSTREAGTCSIPAKTCPNNCGSDDFRGVCTYLSSGSGQRIPPAECSADAPTAACLAVCSCAEDYGGNRCQYSDEELIAVKAIRERALEYVETASLGLDVTSDTLTRQAVLLATLSAFSEEMTTSSNALSLELAASTARLTKENGEGVTENAAMAFVDIVGQVSRTSAHLGEVGNLSALSDVIDDLVTSQVTGMVAGQSSQSIAGDLFRLDTGLYDIATVGGVKISPPLTDADLAVGRVAPSIGLPEELGDRLSDVSRVSLAVGEWMINPRQTPTNYIGNKDAVSSVVRLFADPMETRQSRRLTEHHGQDAGGLRHDVNDRSLLEDFGSLDITMPNVAAVEWDPKQEESITHKCVSDSTETLTGTCPNGTEVHTTCSGKAEVRTVTCSSSYTEPECTYWQGYDALSTANANCKVASFDSVSTTCTCDYAGTIGEGTGSNQVDFASTLLESPAEFISIWSQVTSMMLSDIEEAKSVFSTMACILAAAIVCAGLGWRKDQKNHLNEVVGPKVSSADAEDGTASKRIALTREQNLRSITAAATGRDKAEIDPNSPHHLGERRIKGSLKLLLMVHHDFVSVFYTYYRWFSRPQRVALLLCTVVTLMMADATVFATAMFKDDGQCAANLTESACRGLDLGRLRSSCQWDAGSLNCFLPEPEGDLKTSLIVSTLALIISLPFELLLILIFGACITRPTKGRSGSDKPADSNTGFQRTHSIISRAPLWRAASSTPSAESADPKTSSTRQRLRAEGKERQIAAGSPEDLEGTRALKWIDCGCWGQDRKDSRLVERVKKAIKPALELENRMAQMDNVNAQEALLFEVAEADSLTHLERQVFLRSRIVDFGDEDGLDPVSACTKAMAWLFVAIYAFGFSFYVCLFAIKAGKQTAVQWMISFWIALFEDIVILIPLKLALVHLILPSMMRHRMRPEMFTRIPRYAPSVQVARRRRDLQVSKLILQGSIPEGNEFEKFVPLYHKRRRWFGCLTVVMFTILAAILTLPSTLQSMVVDTVLAIMVGGSCIGMSKLLPLNMWVFAALVVVLVGLLLLCRHNHRQEVRAEKRLREARAGQSERPSRVEEVVSVVSGSSSGKMNIRVLTPVSNEEQSDAARVAVEGSSSNRTSPKSGASSGGMRALSRMFAAINTPTSAYSSDYEVNNNGHRRGRDQSNPIHEDGPIMIAGTDTMRFGANDSDAGSCWPHARDDSVCGSQWQPTHERDDSGPNSRWAGIAMSEATSDRPSPQTDWNASNPGGVGHSPSTWGDESKYMGSPTSDWHSGSGYLESEYQVSPGPRTGRSEGAASSTFFPESRRDGNHRARDSLTMFGDSFDMDHSDVHSNRSPGIMTINGSNWASPQSRAEDSSQHGLPPRDPLSQTGHF